MMKWMVFNIGTLFLLTMCTPAPPAVPPPTAATILDITPVATQDIDATATVYARALIPTPTPAGLYTVQAGDTLGALASEFGTTVEEIMAANNLTDANNIQIGQPLIIPALVSTPKTAEPTAETAETAEGMTPTVVEETATTSTTAEGTAISETPIPTLSTP